MSKIISKKESKNAKKFINRFSISLALILGSSGYLSAANAGFLLGIDIGGAVGALSNNNFNVSSASVQGMPAAAAKETTQINAGLGLGARIGGQGYFNRTNGMRAYLGISGVFGAPSYAFGDLKTTGITGIADINIDYLHDFSANKNLKCGLYLGISTGYLMTFYPGGSALLIQNNDIPRFRGIASGINFGFRAVVNEHNQFEFSTKSVVTNSVATENIFGFQVFIGGNYSYIF